MSDRRSFLDELRVVDQATQAERLRPGAVHRIARRLDAELLQAELPTRRRTWIPMVSFAAGAAMVLAVFTLSAEPELATREEAAPAPLHAAWQVGGDNCHVTRGEVELVLDGSCRVEPPRAGVVIESRETTRLRPVEGGVALVDGTALLEARPRAEASPQDLPWRIEVPGGVLELVGGSVGSSPAATRAFASRLSVVVSGDEGHVDLLEGRMRFVASDGREHAIEPGERFRFSSVQTIAWASPASATSDRDDHDDRDGDGEAPLSATTEPDVTQALEPDSDPPLAAGERLAALGRPETREGKGSRPSGGSRGRDRAKPSSEELRRIVDQVAELRAERRYQDAVSLLRDALGQRWDRRTREVLSYELGTILSTPLREQGQACPHWAEHRRQFPAGRYARAIDRAQARLHCDE